MWDPIKRSISEMKSLINDIGYNFDSIFTFSGGYIDFFTGIVLFVLIGVVVGHLILNLHQSSFTLIKKGIAGILLGVLIVSMSTLLKPDSNVYLSMDLIDTKIADKEELIPSQLSTFESPEVNLGDESFNVYLKPVMIPLSDIYIKDCKSAGSSLTGYSTVGKDSVMLSLCKKETTYYVTLDEKSLINTLNGKLMSDIKLYVSFKEQDRKSQVESKFKQIKSFIEENYVSSSKDLNDVKNIISSRYGDKVSEFKNVFGTQEERDLDKEKEDYMKKYKRLNVNITPLISSMFTSDPYIDIQLGDKKIISYLKVYDLLSQEISGFLLSDENLSFGVNEKKIDGIAYIGTNVYKVGIGDKGSLFQELFPENYEQLNPGTYGEFFFIGKLINDLIVKNIILIAYFLSNLFLIFFIFTIFPLKRIEY